MLTVRGGNRFGALVAGTDTLRHLPARRGRSAFLASLAVVHDSPRQPGAPGDGATVTDALRRLPVVQPRRSQVVVVSDFLGDDPWAGALGGLVRHHDVIAVHVTDPRELTLPDVGILAVVDTETGRQRYVQSASPGLRARYAAAAAARHAQHRAPHREHGRRLPAPVHRPGLAGRHRAVRVRAAPRPTGSPGRHRHRPLPPGGDPMTFQSAWRLLLLVLPVALLVGYVLVQRRRHTQVLRFTSVDLLDSVAPRRQGWQRHVPSAALLLSLVVLTLAFAEPAVAMRTPKDNATIMLTLDTSASMTATDVAPSRLAAAEAQASQFVENLPRGIQVGLVAFDTSARLLVPPTTDRAAAHRRHPGRCPPAAAPRRHPASASRSTRSPRCPRAPPGSPCLQPSC